jgi:hypothetical protein
MRQSLRRLDRMTRRATAPGSTVIFL